MLKNLSTKAKVLAIISAVTALGAVAVLIIILIGGGSSTSSPDNDTNTPGDISYSDIKKALNGLPDPIALNYILEQLDGYWVSGAQFVGFVGNNLEYGLLSSGFGVSGEISGAEISGENAFSLNIFVPARPATEMDDAQPERNELIYIDISNFDLDHRINVKMGAIGSQWYTYDFGGHTLAELQ